jgi:hypothetical protein
MEGIKPVVPGIRIQCPVTERHRRWRTTWESNPAKTRVKKPLRAPAIACGPFGAGSRGRTYAERVLNPLPLPLGYTGDMATRPRFERGKQTFAGSGASIARAIWRSALVLTQDRPI